ncbi:DUF6879 family protein [Streptomyces sp. L7]
MRPDRGGRTWPAGACPGACSIVTQPSRTTSASRSSAYSPAQQPSGRGHSHPRRAQPSQPLEGVQDFWFFDRSRIVLMHYQPDGTQISREVYEWDPELLREYQRIALARSGCPFRGVYVAGLGSCP